MKVVYIISKVSKAVAFEWISEELPKKGVELEFILLGENERTELKEFLDSKGIENHFLKLSSKKYYPNVLLRLIQLLRTSKANAVHTHLFDASLLGLMAARIAGIKNRIYTRHHATYHHDYFPKMVKFDKLINRMATQIVAISPNVKNVLVNRENVQVEKIRTIYHGFDLQRFEHPQEENVQQLKAKYNPNKKGPVIACISRYLELKGIDHVIKAFAQLLQDYPNAYLLLFNAGGPYEKEIKSELAQIDPQSYMEIAFESDVFSIYHLMDVFVHVPIGPNIEAFGQTYVEALAAGIPSVFTMSGIAPEFIKHNENALVVDYSDHKQIYDSIKRILSEKELKDRLISNGKSSLEVFSLNHFINSLEDLYKNESNTFA